MKSANVFDLMAGKAGQTLNTNAAASKKQSGNMKSANNFAAMLGENYSAIPEPAGTQATEADSAYVSAYDQYQRRDVGISQVKDNRSLEDKLAGSEKRLDDFGKQVVAETAEKLGVSEKKVERALEELGLTVADIIEPQNLVELAKEITGVEETAELLMNPGFCELMQDVENLADRLLAELHISAEEIDDFIMYADNEILPEIPDDPDVTDIPEDEADPDDLEGDDLEFEVDEEDFVYDEDDDFQEPEMTLKERFDAVFAENGLTRGQVVTERHVAAETPAAAEEEASVEGAAPVQEVSGTTLVEEPVAGQAVEQQAAVTEVVKPEAVVGSVELPETEEIGTIEISEAVEETVVLVGDEDIDSAGELAEEEEVIELVEVPEETIEPEREEPSGRSELSGTPVQENKAPIENQQASQSEERDPREGQMRQSNRTPVSAPTAGTQMNVQDFREIPFEPQRAETPYLSVDTMDIIKQIADKVRVSIAESETTMELQLNPEHLGKVYMQVTAKEGAVSAQIAAANEAVKHALEMQMVELRENLSQAGVKVDAIEVTVASHEFEQNLEQDARREEQEGERAAEAVSHRRSLNLDFMDEFADVMTEEEALAAQIMRENGNTMDVLA